MRSTMIAVALTLSACSMTPEFVRPEAPIPSQFPLQAVNVNPPSSQYVADIGWHSMFGDPRLQSLIETALRNNRDLRIAVLNVEAAHAAFRVQRAEQLPAVAASVSSNRERSRARSDMPAVQTEVNAGLSVSAFEVDLWGRLRSMSDAAFARYVATDEGRRAVQISLIATVADAYFAERLAVEQESLARRTLDNWTEQRDLALQLQRAKQNGGLEVAQAESQVARAAAELEARTRDVHRSRNALVQLVATPLETLTLTEAIPLERQQVLTDLPPGLPSEVLLNRPDVRQAEQNLRAANADIGAARAAFFPRLSLTTTLGLASPELGNLFRGGNRVWSFVPSVAVPLFDTGRLRAERDLTELRQSVAVSEYEKSVQAAFREVSDGLAGSATFARQIQSQQRVVSAEQRRAELAEIRYRAGVDGRLEWLDAQRSLFAAQLDLLTLRREHLSNAAQLYKALGGGAFRMDKASDHARR